MWARSGWWYAPFMCGSGEIPPPSWRWCGRGRGWWGLHYTTHVMIESREVMTGCRWLCPDIQRVRCDKLPDCKILCTATMLLRLTGKCSGCRVELGAKGSKSTLVRSLLKLRITYTDCLVLKNQSVACIKNCGCGLQPCKRNIMQSPEISVTSTSVLQSAASAHCIRWIRKNNWVPQRL